MKKIVIFFCEFLRKKKNLKSVPNKFKKKKLNLAVKLKALALALAVPTEKAKYFFVTVRKTKKD